MFSKKNVLILITSMLVILVCVQHNLKEQKIIQKSSIDVFLDFTRRVNDKFDVNSTIIKPQLSLKKGHNDNGKVEMCEDSFKHRSYHVNISRIDELKSFIKNNCNGLDVPQCINSNLVGALKVNQEAPNENELLRELSFVNHGGRWRPSGCKESAQTAIIIPFRDRESHLKILLRQLHPILKRQHLHYRIFVIEQVDNFSFNRAKLMNVGFNISQTFFPYSCFVFHDVDLIPENDKIDYGCKLSPAHLSVACNKFSYTLLYKELFGGVEMFTREHFLKINGFSNSFWYWGGEDDNLYTRIKQKNLPIKRQSAKIARYTMIQHIDSKEKKLRSEDDRWRFLEESRSYTDVDGLINLQYDVVEIKEERLFTRISVNLRKDKDKLFGSKDF